MDPVLTEETGEHPLARQIVEMSKRFTQCECHLMPVEWSVKQDG
jgi:hypothetical protein